MNKTKKTKSSYMNKYTGCIYSCTELVEQFKKNIEGYEGYVDMYDIFDDFIEVKKVKGKWVEV